MAAVFTQLSPTTLLVAEHGLILAKKKRQAED